MSSYRSSSSRSSRSYAKDVPRAFPQSKFSKESYGIQALPSAPTGFDLNSVEMKYLDVNLGSSAVFPSNIIFQFSLNNSLPQNGGGPTAPLFPVIPGTNQMVLNAISEGTGVGNRTGRVVDVDRVEFSFDINTSASAPGDQNEVWMALVYCVRGNTNTVPPTNSPVLSPFTSPCSNQTYAPSGGLLTNFATHDRYVVLWFEKVIVGNTDLGPVEPTINRTIRIPGPYRRANYQNQTNDPTSIIPTNGSLMLFGGSNPEVSNGTPWQDFSDPEFFADGVARVYFTDA